MTTVRHSKQHGGLRLPPYFRAQAWQRKQGINWKRDVYSALYSRALSILNYQTMDAEELEGVLYYEALDAAPEVISLDDDATVSAHRHISPICESAAQAAIKNFDPTYMDKVRERAREGGRKSKRTSAVPMAQIAETISLTNKQASELLGISVSTLQRQRKAYKAGIGELTVSEQEALEFWQQTSNVRVTWYDPSSEPDLVAEMEGILDRFVATPMPYEPPKRREASAVIAPEGFDNERARPVKRKVLFRPTEAVEADEPYTPEEMTYLFGFDMPRSSEEIKADRVAEAAERAIWIASMGASYQH